MTTAQDGGELNEAEREILRLRDELAVQRREYQSVRDHAIELKRWQREAAGALYFAKGFASKEITRRAADLVDEANRECGDPTCV